MRVLLRILVALFFVGCGVAPAVFLNLLFGVNSRTLAVSAALVAGVGMLACTVDLALRGSTPSAHDTDRYGKRMKALMIVLGIVLFSAIAVFIAEIGWAVYKSVRV
jgi:hypothetical protein